MKGFPCPGERMELWCGVKIELKGQPNYNNSGWTWLSGSVSAQKAGNHGLIHAAHTIFGTMVA